MIRDKEGNNLLNMLAQKESIEDNDKKGYLDLTKKLIDLSGDTLIDQSNKKGKTALEYAQGKKNNIVVQTIEETKKLKKKQEHELEPLEGKITTLGSALANVK